MTDHLKVYEEFKNKKMDANKLIIYVAGAFLFIWVLSYIYIVLLWILGGTLIVLGIYQWKKNNVETRNKRKRKN